DPSTSAEDLYQYTSGPGSIGPGGLLVYPSSGVGGLAGIGGHGAFSILNVPVGYHSDDPISASSTWDNTTISGLGLSPGTYTWTSGSAANGTADDLVINVPGTATPEPASITLFGLGSLGLLGYGWRKRIQAA